MDINPETFRQECFAVSKAMIRSLRHHPSIPREDDGAVRFDGIMKELEAKFDGASQWSISDWISFLAKGRGPKKRFQCCLGPNSSKHFLYLRAIQRHSRGNDIDPELQDDVLLPEDFTEFIYHVGNVSETCSIIDSGLMPGGKSLERDRQSVFFHYSEPDVFHYSEPDGRRSKYGRKSMRLEYTWRPHQNAVYWCNLKVAQKKGLQFYQTRSHAIVLYNILPAICIEKAVCMKTKEELYHKVYQSPRVPRILLKPNSQSGRQDQPDQEARECSDHPSASGSHGETRSGNVDNRIPGIPHSTVQQQDTNRRETVKKLTQQFENHPNKESFLQDLDQTEEINMLSEKSKKLITDMGNTEIFQLCETSSKKQCPDCAFILGNWHCIWFMRKMSDTFAEYQKVGQEEL